MPYVIDQTKSLETYDEAQLATMAIWEDNNTDFAYNMPNSGLNLTQAESDESNSISSDIETYTQENIAKFITGGKSLDEFDDFVATLKDLNIDRLIEIEQAAYDRYLNS